MKRSFAAIALSFLLSLPAMSQVLSQELIQGELGQMLLDAMPEAAQTPAASAPSAEPEQPIEDAAAPVETLEDVTPTSQRKATLSASQAYFQMLLGEVLQPFGMSEFKNPGGNELLLFNALSDDYKLSAGDQLQIVIRGLSPGNLNVVLDRNGAVTLPQFLPTTLAGLSVSEAAEHLSEMIQVNDASARVSVVVTAARLVPVQIGGMVRKPQVLAVPAYTPLGLALSRSGGLQPDASLRNIRMISQEGSTRVIDLYGFLLGEADFREPLLTEGERVFVPTAGGSVAITGLVPRHGIFELAPGQDSISVAEALKLSGLSLVPRGLPLERLFFDTNGLPVSVAVSDHETTRLANGEALRVGLVKTVPLGNVMVLGAVVEPFSQPFVKDLRLSDVLKGGAVFSLEADGDFIVLMSPTGANSEPFRLIAVKEMQAGIVNPVLEPGTQILVPSRGQVASILRSVAGEADASVDAIERGVADNILVSEPIQVFVDGRILALVPAGTKVGLVDRFNVALARTNVYEGYALLEDRMGSLIPFNVGRLEGDGLLGLKMERGSTLHLFSREFVTSVVRGRVKEDTVNIASADLSLIPQVEEKIYRRMVADARLVLGEVSEPGAYPFAGRMTLSDVLAASGGILPSGDRSAVLLREYSVDGSTLRVAEERVIDTTQVDPTSVVLEGIFGVRVQPLINDAIVGIVTIGGEVRRPGRISIQRGDTIADVLARAGGLTATAYPLGAVLARTNLVVEERESNAELANQLRRQSAMLQAENANGDVDHATAALLDFADQLESTAAAGRQVVNIADPAEATFVLMQDGDRLVVPKRPSHVRIMGAVYSEVAALYREGASAADYVSDAGGLTRFADPRRTFMVLPNGKSIPLNLRRKDGDAQVPPGSVIVVPPKVDRVSAMKFTETISRALGSVASSMLALDVLTGQ
jgi:protein involved in polysaccharide export with SLBB domain